MKILMLTRYGRLGASSRLRTFQYIPWFEKAGIQCTVVPFIDNTQLQNRYVNNRYRFIEQIKIYHRRLNVLCQQQGHDLIWIEKEALPWLPAWFETLLLGTTPYILDYDDAVFHNYDLHNSKWVRCLLGNRIDRLMTNATLVIAGNKYLAQRAKTAGATQVEIVPTVIDLTRYPLSNNFKEVNSNPRIVWIGSPMTMKYIELIKEPLRILSQQKKFKFRIIGKKAVDIFGVDTEFIPWDESNEVSSLQVCDVGVMPLNDSPWERGKCGYKLIQYMACSLPVVASPIGVNSEIIKSNEFGFLAHSNEEWIEFLSILLSSKFSRVQMGAAARQSIEKNFSLQVTAPRLISLLNSLL